MTDLAANGTIVANPVPIAVALPEQKVTTKRLPGPCKPRTTTVTSAPAGGLGALIQRSPLRRAPPSWAVPFSLCLSGLAVSPALSASPGQSGDEDVHVGAAPATRGVPSTRRGVADH